MTLKEFYELVEDMYETATPTQRKATVHTHTGGHVTALELEEDPYWGDNCYYVTGDGDDPDY